MLIAMSLASVLVASMAAPAFIGGGPSAVATSIPPLVINLAVAPDISPTLVALVLDETNAIFRSSGFTFVWERTPLRKGHASAPGEAGPYRPSALRVDIGGERGVARDHRTPLGWIVFDDDRSPQQKIYLSHANAMALMEAARPVVGIVAQMPIAQREVLLARAMGRALAHELAHYLLASKVHTPKGLLRASRTASELFSNDRRPFGIDAAQRQQIVARLQGEPLVASR
jgi:hypothetical protein